jgi:D-tyrosyl-tRNA(Tyr) deacylase
VITLVQRVRRAVVTIDGEVVGQTGPGLLLFVGVEAGDSEADAETTARKVAALRCFSGRTPMDRSVLETGGGCLVVSQFTLTAELRYGNRPDFTAAAPVELAEPLYLRVAAALTALGITTATGRFGAHMTVELSNDGPVTFLVTVRGGKVEARRALAPAT